MEKIKSNAFAADTRKRYVKTTSTAHSMLSIVVFYQNTILGIIAALCIVVSVSSYYTFVLKAELRSVEDQVQHLQQSNGNQLLLAIIADRDEAQQIESPSDFIQQNSIELDSMEQERSLFKAESDDRDAAAGRSKRSAIRNDGGRFDDVGEYSLRRSEQSDHRISPMKDHPDRKYRGHVTSGQEVPDLRARSRERGRGRHATPQGAVAAHYEARRGKDKYHVSAHRAPAILSIWKSSNMSISEVMSPFVLNEKTGVVTINESGLYWVYAQLVYHDKTKRWAFGIFINDQVRVKCINTEQNVDVLSSQQQHVDTARTRSHGVYQHCYTASMLRILQNDTISIRCLYGQKTIVMQPEFTFWGIARFG